MQDLALVQACIEEHYVLRPRTLQPFNPNSWTSTERQTYRVIYADGTSTVLRAYRPGWVERTMPYDGFDTWLHTRAALLAWLEHHRYPAPRLIRTGQGNAVAAHQDWGILMTTFIEGTSPAPEPHTFELLGATLARLHVLPDSRIPPQELVVSHSWWNHHLAIAAALERLGRLAQMAPAQWQELLAALRTTLSTLQHRVDLPQGVIHADCWIGNAIGNGKGDIVLIDWEFAGAGPLILDLAGLLSNGHLDLPAAQPSRERITAIMRGYGTYRKVSAVEVGVLQAAIQFGAAFRVAMQGAALASSGWNEKIERRLKREQARYNESAGIAELALWTIEQAGPREH